MSLEEEPSQKKDLTTKTQIFKFSRVYKEGDEDTRRTVKPSADLLLRENAEGTRDDPSIVIEFLEFVSENILDEGRPVINSQLKTQAILAAVDE